MAVRDFQKASEMRFSLCKPLPLVPQESALRALVFRGSKSYDHMIRVGPELKIVSSKLAH
jgi:hypothetical protein